mmetsp:Transcript_50401/g.126988  ORF Transcript_50401/g.126988 Transcript_50401/m.126988 type:complete len:365 (+) Transcript_50401:771-1865(+)
MLALRKGSDLCLRGCHELGDQRLPLQRAAVHQSLLKNVCNHADLCIAQDALPELCDNLTSLVVQAMLKHTLHHMVAIRVREQRTCLGENSVNQLDRAFVSRCVLQEPTKHAAAILVACKVRADVHHLLNDEGHLLQRQYPNYFLDDVVCMRRLDSRDDRVAQPCCQLRSQAAIRHVQGKLHRPAARWTESKVFHQAWLLQRHQCFLASLTTGVQLRQQLGSEVAAKPCTAPSCLLPRLLLMLPTMLHSPLPALSPHQGTSQAALRRMYRILGHGGSISSLPTLDHRRGYASRDFLRVTEERQASIGRRLHSQGHRAGRDCRTHRHCDHIEVRLRGSCARRLGRPCGRRRCSIGTSRELHPLLLL